MKMSPNPNDTTADIYDIYTRTLKGPEVTNAELELINSLIVPPAKILDIGGGTGRHAIPLAQAENEVTVIDSSHAMLEQLGKKEAKVKTIHADILQYSLKPNSYDLIIMMWNSFNEIALTEDYALKLLRKCKEALTENGKILINSDDPDNFDPASLAFTTEFETDNFTYSQDWKVINFDKSTNTTTSQEIIRVKDDNGQVLREENNQIAQRWWSLAEISSLASQLELSLTTKSVPVNDELYLIV